MNSYAREFIFVLAVTFTAIAALQNGPTKTSRAAPPTLFFEEPSLITDFYNGELNRLNALVSEKDISLVMYYAPWDAKSIRTKAEFEDAAKFYHHEVFFAAINCWWPDGECSQKYKILTFPLIVLYVHDVGVIRFDAPAMANYIVSFLDNALAPIVVLQNTGELVDLLTKHEGVLIGYFEFKGGGQSESYSQYYATALRALTRDPYRSLCFAVITNEKTLSKFRMKTGIQLQLWNKTEVYTEPVISVNNLLQWAYGKLPQLTQWITPAGSKSRLLSTVIGKSPALIMFTPRNMIFESSSYYDLLREVALDYNNCNSSFEAMSVVHHIVLRRHILQETVTKLFHGCKLSSQEETQTTSVQSANKCDLMCCQTRPLSLGPRGALKCNCRVCLHHAVDSTSKMKLSECENTLALILKSFKTSLLHVDSDCHMIEASLPTKFGAYNRLSFRCSENPENMQMKTALGDDYSILDKPLETQDDHVLSLIKSVKRNLCLRLRLAHQYSNISFPEFPVYENNDWRTNFTGLGCRTNRTVIFVAMDALVSTSFAENLGIDVMHSHHQTTAVLVEPMQEIAYLLEEKVNKKSLVEFVKNYTDGSLTRFLRSSIRKLDSCSKEEGEICLTELTTSTFLEFVLNNRADVVLMYYSPMCGACISVYHIFLSVASFFADISQIKFARVKGDEYDLPWEYTVDRYPTIVFFPAYRKENSLRFNAELPITETNLFHFILINCHPKVRWTVTMQMCNRKCVAYNLVRSSSEIRHLLREYRSLLNQVQLVRFIAAEKAKPKKTKFKKFTSSKLSSHKEEEEEWWGNYMKNLIRHIRNKKSKIKQAYELLYLLKEKRNSFLKDKRSKSFSRVNERLDNNLYSDIHDPLSEMQAHIKTDVTRTRVKDEL